MASRIPGAALSELRWGMRLPKCRRCGCMEGALTAVSALPSGALDAADSSEAEQWRARMEPVQYDCLGCKKCYAADALNALQNSFPEVLQEGPSCGLGPERPGWPPIPGEYYNTCRSDGCTVAVSTLASPALAKTLADNAPPELCIAGKTETENIGLDKIIKNTVTNPSIRHLIVAGPEPKGHHSGQTLLALARNGVDDSMRVAGSTGRRPFLNNVSRQEVEAFRSQVTVVDMIGCEDPAAILAKIREEGSRGTGEKTSCGCAACGCEPAGPRVNLPPVLKAEEPRSVKMDRAGYFVILPLRDKRLIHVEHYDYGHHLLHTVEGRTARSLYWTIIREGWATELLHAAYLGKELARAERSLETGAPFIQDGAGGET